jgi:hypothetical protein
MSGVEPIDLYWLNRRLDIATEEVRRLDPEMAMWELKQAFPGLQTVSTAPNGNQIFNFADKSIEVGPMASNDEIAVALENPFIRTENTRLTLGAIDRLREKALQAKGVVPRVVASIEAELDGVIAAEADLAKQKDEAFAPHKAALAETKAELDGVKDALNIMSNGAPE